MILEGTDVVLLIKASDQKTLPVCVYVCCSEGQSILLFNLEDIFVLSQLIWVYMPHSFSFTLFSYGVDVSLRYIITEEEAEPRQPSHSDFYCFDAFAEIFS